MKNKSHVVSWVPLLGVTFVALRLMGYIDWEWRVVLAPFWVPLAVFLGCLIILAAIKYYDLIK